MTVKCIKCGADTPDNASFCPSCGAPKQVEQPDVFQNQEPVDQPAPQQTYVAPPPPVPKTKKPAGEDIKKLIDTLFTKKMIIIIFFIAVLVAWITRIINQFVYAGSTASNALNIVNFTFMAGIGAILFSGGLLNTKFDKYLRLGLIIAGALFLVQNL